MKPLFVSDMFLIFNAEYIANSKTFYRFSHRITFGLAGAILMDLMIYKKVELNGKRFIIIDTHSTEDPFLDEALSFLSKLKENKRISYYINNIIGSGNHLFSLLIERLAHLNFINISMITMRKFRVSIPHFTVEYVNQEIQNAVIDKLREVLLQNLYVSNKAIWYLISLLRATNGYRHILGVENRNQVKARIKELIIDEPIGKSVKWKINNAESADSSAF